jgi:hypothetical protein
MPEPATFKSEGVSHERIAIRPYINPAVGARLTSPLDLI